MKCLKMEPDIPAPDGKNQKPFLSTSENPFRTWTFFICFFGVMVFVLTAHLYQFGSDKKATFENGVKPALLFGNNDKHSCNPDENKACSKRLPSCLIIGVQKAGMLALFQFLSQHPDVIRNRNYTELHFFDQYYEKGHDWYLDQMPYTLPGQIAIEKSPSYFIEKNVPERVLATKPDIRLLLIVRDPVARAVSSYTTWTNRRKGHVPDFEDVVFPKPNKTLDHSVRFVAESVYSFFFSRWLRYFKRNQFHVIDGDIFARNPAHELQQVEQFLGLRTFFTEKMFVFNETKQHYCFSGTDKVNEMQRMQCLPDNKGNKHTDIEDDTISKLRDYYAPFNLKFFEMTNIMFHWQ